MTGIERLYDVVRELGGMTFFYDLYARLHDIADQIEREQACDGDTAENVRLIVGGVVDDMERHVLGHEGMEDIPVDRWARELGEALGGHETDITDTAATQSPSCADTSETASVSSDAAKVTRDPAEDVSMSAYDLLPQEEREAIAWVREHGGLEIVGNRDDALGYVLDWLRDLCGVKKDETKDLDEMMQTVESRLMPDGMEWLVEAWPRFEDSYAAVLGTSEACAQFECRAERMCKSVSPYGLNDRSDAFSFKCSECGAFVDSDDMGYSPLVVDEECEPLRFCPNCGARVVSER